MRAISLWLVLAFASSTAVAQLCGDCNSDGVLSILDALRAAQISAGVIAAQPTDFFVCDVDDDVDIDIIDALRTAQASAGLVIPLVCPPPLPTTCTLTAPLGGFFCLDVDLTFDVSSPRPDVDVSSRFSTDVGATWSAATPSLASPLGNPALAVPPALGLSFVWDTATDLPVGQHAVVFEICVDGANCCTTTFTVQAPCASSPVITAPVAAATVCADVAVVVTLASLAPSASLDLSYSTDGGVSFALATMAAGSALSNPAMGVAPGAGLTFTWDSNADLPAGHVGTVLAVCADLTACTQITVDVVNPCPPSSIPDPGDLVITEIMQNPLAVADSNGEWFEVRNVSMRTLDLDGCTLIDLGVDSHVIAPGGPLTVAAGAAIVLGIDANPVTNGNVPVAYQYASFFLGNADDEIILLNPSLVEVVRVAYDGGPAVGGIWPDPNGASMSLDPASTTPMSAMNPANWCEATAAWSGADLGSPGAVNPVCVPSSLPPTCAMTTGAGCDAGDVPVDFDALDPDSSSVDVSLFYSTDDGATWILATPSPAALPPFTANPALGVVPAAGLQAIWDSAADLPTFCGAVRLQVEVDDGVSQVLCASTGLLLISNPVGAVQPPMASITSPAPAAMVPLGTVTISIDASDADSSCLAANVDVSTDGGATFVLACPAAGATPPWHRNPSIVPAPSLTDFLWDTSCNGVMAGNVLVRVTVDDCVQVTQATVAFTLTGAGTPAPVAGEVVVNEIHADPSATAGDANGDGTISITQDEFVELVNIAAGARDLTGLELRDAFGVRHVCPAGSIVPSGGALIVFGGGTLTPGGYGGNPAQTASTGTLGLNNTGDTVTLQTAGGALVIDTYVYGAEGGNDTSLVRDPEASSAPMSAGGTPLILHTAAPGAGGALYSPGTKVTGATSW